MVIDTSVLIAIALGEPVRQRLLDALELETDRLASSMSLLEAGMIVRALLGEAAVRLLYHLVDEIMSEVVALDQAQARLAITAFGRFGKAMGHRAQLNFGDCAVYALALSRGDQILATGNNFVATGLPCCRLTP